ncbi:MAG: hypothetical protein AAF356_02655 [Planctomycetota bacterium]
MRIALVTCLDLPEPDLDEAPLLAALRAAGHDAQPLAWDDPTAHPAAFDVCVLRATWNYYHHLDAFASWLASTAATTRLLNPLETVRWNLHKGYLLDLEASGIPVVPTALIDRGGETEVVDLLAQRGWDDVVIKPAVSAGSHGTKRFGAREKPDAQAWLSTLLATGDAMVQRFEPAVEREGELSIVCIGGEISHAFEKRPRFDGDDESVVGRGSLSAAERAFAELVLTAADRPWLYARVDVFPGDDGGLLLSELELIEPSLYFHFANGSAERMVRAIEAHAASPAG